MHNDSTLLKAQSPAALAEEYIVKSIWNNYFPPGSDLPAERELADKIGVTRTTLREVLQPFVTLEFSSLLDSRDHDSARWHKIAFAYCQHALGAY